MKWCIAIFICVCALAVTSYSQTAAPCPAGYICYTQDQNNEISKRLNELIASKDAIIKMLSERNASTAALDAANKVIEAMNERDAINGMIIVKLKDVMALYEKTMALYADLVTKLETQLHKPKSTWDKIVDTVKAVVTFAAGVAIGRL